MDLDNAKSAASGTTGTYNNESIKSEEDTLRPLLSQDQFKIKPSKYAQSLPAERNRAGYTPSETGSAFYPQSERRFQNEQNQRPPLLSQSSLISLSKLPFIMQAAESSQNLKGGVDENIYHWKVLNLSRAKLKASSRTSALLSGFAMVAMVEIQIDEKVPLGLMVTFVVCTVLLIAVHMLALMISTCVLPNVEAVANLHFQTQKTVFESPHSTMNFIVELAWGFSTVLGILLFLLEIAILCWVKFYSLSHVAAWVATGLLIPIMGIFIAFAAHFYLKLMAHKSSQASKELDELDKLKQGLENAGVNGGSVQIV